MPETDWPFDQPRNCAVITLRSIAFDNAPILHVSHDIDDHGWQFLGAEDACEENSCVLSLENIVELDPTILEVAEIPPGWHAWRESLSSPWMRESNPQDAG